MLKYTVSLYTSIPFGLKALYRNIIIPEVHVEDVKTENDENENNSESGVIFDNLAIPEIKIKPKNRENAMRQLRSILYDKELQHRMAEQAKVEAGKKKIEWGSQIRSYVFDDRRVKDHRTNFQTSDVNGVMDGKIDGFVKAYLMEFAGGDNI